MNKPRLNYIPGSMSFAEGFFGPRGNVGFIMRYDHKKAVAIIKKILKTDKKILNVVAGLDGDFTENSCIIYDGEFHPYTSYPKSIWATPIMIVNYQNHLSETYEVWRNE